MATMAVGAGLAAAGGIISALNSAPSAAQLTLNSQLQDFTKFMQGQAKTEGIDASSVFQKVMGSPGLPGQTLHTDGTGRTYWA